MPNSKRPDLDLWNKLLPAAKEMRHEPTPAEQALWERLRNRKVAGLKFRRQVVVKQFIVDFYCAEVKLAIEVDGAIHRHTIVADEVRQTFLESLGIVVIRFTNDEVLGNINAVVKRIEDAVGPHPLAPSTIAW